MLLVGLMATHPDELAADMQAHYHGTPGHFRRLGYPPSEVAAFAANLPADGAVAHALGSATVPTELLVAAATLDAVNIGNWQRGGNRHAKRPTSMVAHLIKPVADARITPDNATDDTAEFDTWRTSKLTR